MIIAIISANNVIFSIQLKNFTLTIVNSSDTVTLTQWRVVTKAEHVGMVIIFTKNNNAQKELPVVPLLNIMTAVSSK